MAMMELIPNKSLGQHWLNDSTALQDIVSMADIDPSDYILEIGPGLGSLTDKLLESSAEILALEYDPRLKASLENKYRQLKTNQLTIKEGDIREYDLSTLPDPYKIVANIPYYLTAYLLRLLTDTPHKPQTAVLLVQKEVAQRVAETPGKLTFIAVAVQFYYHVDLARMIKAELFSPPPKVDSQILILKKREQVLFPDVDPKEFFRIVKAGFSQRRKTMTNSLSAGLHLTKEETIELLEKAGLSPSTRAQNLSLEQWHELYKSRFP